MFGLIVSFFRDSFRGLEINAQFVSFELCILHFSLLRHMMFFFSFLVCAININPRNQNSFIYAPWVGSPKSLQYVLNFNFFDQVDSEKIGFNRLTDRYECDPIMVFRYFFWGKIKC